MGCVSCGTRLDDGVEKRTNTCSDCLDDVQNAAKN